MSNQPRVAKVWATLLIAMTTGAIVLMALGNHPPSAGPFCLASYYRLDSVEKTLLSRTPQNPDRYNSIEIYYSGTRAGNIDQLTSLNGLAGPEDLDCHFVICNGLGGRDGQIQQTEKWHRQWIIPAETSYGRRRPVRICLIADGRTAPPTDFQLKRAEALVEALARKFNIRHEATRYPPNWH